MDLGNEKIREYIVPDNVTKFSFLDFDKSKIVLQTSDTSSSKFLLDTKTGQISKVDFSQLGMKGYLYTQFKEDTLNQCFWHYKNGEIELYDANKKHFFYFKSIPFSDFIFTEKCAVFSTNRGLKVFDYQRFKLDSITEIPDWKFEIEYADDENIFINSDQLFNLKNKTIAPLSREKVRERIAYCFHSESKFKMKIGEKQRENSSNISLEQYLGRFFYIQDTKNTYVLYKGRIVVWNKLYLGKNSEKEIIAYDYKNGAVKELQPSQWHDYRKDSIKAWQLNKFIYFQHDVEDNAPNDILTKYKIYQICTKANKERFGNVYQYVRNPFDLDYGLSDEQLIDLERIARQKKYPKAYESNIYTILFDEYNSLFDYNKAMKYYKIWEKKYGKDSIFHYSEDLARVSKIKKNIDILRRKKVSNDIILYKKIQMMKKEGINSKYYEWEICQKILKQYPNSIYADDIELGIFNKAIVRNENDEYNRRVSKSDIMKLKKIIAKYPNSNLKKEFEFAMINTFVCMDRNNATSAADSIRLFNYQLKGAEMLIDFYNKNLNFYQCSKNEYEADCEIKQRLIYAKQNLEALKFEKNIRVSLSCPKKEYDRKEPIILTYTIKNVGQEEQEIETNEIDGLAYFRLLFNVVNYRTEGCALDSILFFQRIVKATPKSTKRVLKAGEIVSFPIDITKLANLRAKEFSEFENPLRYCRYPNSYGRLEFLQPQNLEIYIDFRLTPSNKLSIKIK
jgi:hypothetical protein